MVRDEKAERRELALGTRQQGWVEVRSGIAAGEPVVITGHTRLGSGAPVKVVEDADALVPGTAAAFKDQKG